MVLLLIFREWAGNPHMNQSIERNFLEGILPQTRRNSYGSPFGGHFAKLEMSEGLFFYGTISINEWRNYLLNRPPRDG